MNCIFCKQPSGLFRSYHEECLKKVQTLLQNMENIVNLYTRSASGAEAARKELVRLASSDEMYRNYLEHEIRDLTGIKAEETIIYSESGLCISESENRCTMMRTGCRYEKKPVWCESNLLIGENVSVVLTDRSICLMLQDKCRTYQYHNIVSQGYDKKWGFVYFDVKTTSRYPHRFSIRPFITREKSRTRNLYLFLNLFSDK